MTILAPMSIGKEIRPSFLNTELIATLFKLKKSDQYKRNFGKYLLRKTYEKDLSKKIVFSKKRNIQTPQTVWFRTNLSEWLDNFLKEANIWEYGWLDKENFFKNYKLFKEGKINNSFFIWKVINLELWNNNLIYSSN